MPCASQRDLGATMPKVLAHCSLTAHSVDSALATEAVDLEQLRDDLIVAGARIPRGQQLSPVLLDCDHMVLATERGRDKCVGLLGATDGTTDCDEPYLFIRIAWAPDDLSGASLIQRMMALALLRATGNRTLPQVIAVRTDDRLVHRALGSMFERVVDRALYPSPVPNVISLSAAALGRRVARHAVPGARLDVATGLLRPGPAGRGLSDQLVIVDLRACNPGDVIEEARRLYRRRSSFALPLRPTGVNRARRRATPHPGPLPQGKRELLSASLAES